MTDRVSPVAASVINRLGGLDVVAGWLGLTRGGVYKFTKSKAQGGTGGRIPDFHQATLLARAAEAGVDLSPLDFHEAPFGNVNADGPVALARAS